MTSAESEKSITCPTWQAGSLQRATELSAVAANARPWSKGECILPLLAELKRMTLDSRARSRQWSFETRNERGGPLRTDFCKLPDWAFWSRRVSVSLFGLSQRHTRTERQPCRRHPLARICLSPPSLKIIIHLDIYRHNGKLLQPCSQGRRAPKWCVSITLLRSYGSQQPSSISLAFDHQKQHRRHSLAARFSTQNLAASTSNTVFGIDNMHLSWQLRREIMHQQYVGSRMGWQCHGPWLETLVVLGAALVCIAAFKGLI